MLVIWKYPFPVTDFFTTRMPASTQFLCLQVQKEVPTMWHRHEESAEQVERIFRVIGTGQPHTDMAEDTYLGTFQLYDGEFVGHLFEVNAGVLHV